ncbi:MAG: glucoamylase family protein, partial [Candidatus Eiseniibacteriota bacterium]
MRHSLQLLLRRTLIVAGLATLCATPAFAETVDAMLDSLQATAFQYFWNEANPSNGLIKDRDTPGSPCSIAAVGFGLSAICIGADHDWVTRAEAQARVRTTLNTFWTGPQGTGTAGIIGYQGLFYHFLDMTTATRTWDSELSTIDTALLLAGILDTKMYFSSADTGDVAIRALADSIYRRTDWEWARNSGNAIAMGWLPTTEFSTFGNWVGYNEAMILYILALGSPTHAPASFTWNTWVTGYNWQTQYGQTYIIFPPLFGHQYSQCWLDLRHANDNYNRFRGITYFENSRRATLAQRAYAIANPGHFTAYSDTLWGLTASDVPSGYNARGAPPAQNDDGTITPTAPISSIAFAPDEVIPVIRNLYNGYKPYLWSPYGFRDAFNLQVGWWDTDVLGID